MVNLRIIEVREREKLTAVKAIAATVFFSCAILLRKPRSGGRSILEAINSDVLLYLGVTMAILAGLTILICFVLEQVSKQVHVGNLLFADNTIEHIQKDETEYIPYANIKYVFIEQSYSITSSSLFQIRIDTDEENYSFTCELSSWGTARYVGSFLTDKGVTCDFSERRVQAEVAAERAKKWL